MRIGYFWMIGLVLVGLGCGRGARLREAAPAGRVAYTDAEKRFEGDIAQFWVRDSVMAPAREGIVFVGSSSFTRWDSLLRDFAPLPVVNRGFGGSGIRQVTYFSDQIVVPLRPKVIFFYCGENDICNDHNPAEMALEDFQGFVRHVRASLPEVRIVYLSMKPSPLRWKYWEKFKSANRMIEAYTREERGLRYVDVGSAMLDSTGRPHRHIWMGDSLHLNAEGYKIWTGILRPVAMEEYGWGGVGGGR